MTLNLDDIRILELSRVYDLANFDCGDSDLNDFLKNESLQYQNKRLATTFLAIYDQQVIGFFSIVNDAIRLEKEEKKESRIKHLHDYPALKIARMGVVKALQKKGIGSLLVKNAIGRALECKHGACRFVTVDAYPDKLGFYKKLGFRKNLHKKYRDKDHLPMRLDLLNPD